MLTRTNLGSRNFDITPAGMTVPPANSWRRGQLIRSGTPGFQPPRPIPMMDPSDPTTWTRRVIFTGGLA